MKNQDNYFRIQISASKTFTPVLGQTVIIKYAVNISNSSSVNKIVISYALVPLN